MCDDVRARVDAQKREWRHDAFNPFEDNPDSPGVLLVPHGLDPPSSDRATAPLGGVVVDLAQLDQRLNGEFLECVQSLPRLHNLILRCRLAAVAATMIIGPSLVFVW